MKRALLIFVVVVVMGLFAPVAQAQTQTIIVVDSEQIFKSLPEYNAALSTIDRLTERCKAEVEQRFAEVENMFNLYTLGRASYSEAKRRETEALILNKEKEATAYQEECFADDGVIMKERLSLIEPIQKRVFAAIDSYAKSAGVDMVMDRSANPSLLYSSDRVDHTSKVIEILNKVD